MCVRRRGKCRCHRCCAGAAVAGTDCYQPGGSVEVAVPAGGGKVAFNCGTPAYAGLEPADPLKAYDAECNAELMLSSISPTAVRTALPPETGTQAPFRTFTVEVKQLPAVPVKICYMCAAGQPAAGAPPPTAGTAPDGQAAGPTAGQVGNEGQVSAAAPGVKAGTQGAPVGASAPPTTVPAAPTAALAVHPGAILLSYISLRNAQAPTAVPAVQAAAAAAPAVQAAAAAAAPAAQAAAEAPAAQAAPEAPAAQAAAEAPAAQAAAAAPATQAAAAPPPATQAAAAAAAPPGTAGGPLLVTSSPERRNKACKVYVTIPASAIPVPPDLLLTTVAILFTLFFELVH